MPVASRGLEASSGPDPPKPTTFSSRTFLQPQLALACKASDKKGKSESKPKDFLLFSPASLAVADYGAENTPRRQFLSEMVLPAFEWPSSHGLVHTIFMPQPVVWQ